MLLSPEDGGHNDRSAVPHQLLLTISLLIGCNSLASDERVPNATRRLIIQVMDLLGIEIS